MSLKQRKPHLGDPERKEWVACNDCKTAQRVELFGTKYDSHAVRSLCGL